MRAKELAQQRLIKHAFVLSIVLLGAKHLGQRASVLVVQQVWEECQGDPTSWAPSRKAVENPGTTLATECPDNFATWFAVLLQMLGTLLDLEHRLVNAGDMIERRRVRPTTAIAMAIGREDRLGARGDSDPKHKGRAIAAPAQLEVLCRFGF